MLIVHLYNTAISKCHSLPNCSIFHSENGKLFGNHVGGNWKIYWYICCKSHCSSFRMYWAQETRNSTIADVMARNHFDKLRTYFHINENSLAPSRENFTYDKFYKIKPFIHALKTNIQKIETEENNSIDGLIISFKSHSGLKQLIKNKSHKWSIKVNRRQWYFQKLLGN